MNVTWAPVDVSTCALTRCQATHAVVTQDTNSTKMDGDAVLKESKLQVLLLFLYLCL